MIGEYVIKWKRTTNGEVAFIGEIKVAQYSWNSIDSKNGKYRGGSLLPQSKLSFKTDDIEEIKRLVKEDVIDFFEKLKG